MILGVDVGGTFTDFVLLDAAGQVRIHKVLTSAQDQSEALLQGISELDVGLDTSVVHGATVATNALLARRGARTALITTEGFTDVLEIGRQNRPDLYALHPTRPPPLVPGALRFGIPERVAPARDRGKAPVDCCVLVSPDLEAVDAVAQNLVDSEIESVAVCLLFSFLYPDHERLISERILAAPWPSAPLVFLSSDIAPEFREYERMSTTVINAYVAPLMNRYLSNLEDGLDGRNLRIMQSNGGSISASAARAQAARTALSGPAGGVVGAFEAAQRAGFAQSITFDMGGTSTDVSVCPGQIPMAAEGSIGGLPLRLPIIDIHTVGTGGGSLARLDAGGALRVGPESAGADPGPVCYGRDAATQITVTDANLFLGRLDAGHLLGGRMALHANRAEESMQALAQRLSLPPEAAAWGVIRVANANMERAIRQISMERGYDPRQFTLVAFGGAGPQHACDLAATLRISRVLIPPFPGVLSALGMVLADTVKGYSQTVMLSAGDANAFDLEQLFAPIQDRAYADLRSEGLSDGDVVLARALDMRYPGQSSEITVELPENSFSTDGALVAGFHAAHRQRFSYAAEDEPVEIVNLRLTAMGRTEKPDFPKMPLGDPNPQSAHIGYKQVHLSEPERPQAVRPFLAALYERENLTAGNILVGPAVVFQLDTTTLIPPGWVAKVDEWGNLVVEMQS